MKHITLIIALILLAGCATSPAEYATANCWGKDDPLKCRRPAPAGCQELAANMYWCGADPLDKYLAKRAQ